MTPLTATERGELAETLLPVAAQLICLVHGDGGPREIQQLLVQLDPAELTAMVVLVAALADPDRQLTDALGWVTWDEHGRPAAPARVAGTVRDLAAEAEQLPPPQDRRAVVIEDTALLIRQGLGRDGIVARLGISWDAIGRAHLREGLRTPELAA